MRASVSSVQIAHLLIEGAVIAFSLELTLKNLLACLADSAHTGRRNAQTKYFHYLKLLMALTMIVKSAILSAFSSSALKADCRVAGKIADAFYHLAYLLGDIILLQRVTVLIPTDKRTPATIFHTILAILRFIIGVVDIFFVQVSKSEVFCSFRAEHEVGTTYTLIDTVVDIYVSTMVAIILCSHIKLLKRNGVAGNISVYFSLVVVNVIRTVSLTVLNLVCAVYFIVASDESILEIILWPISNLFFIVLVGFDTDISKTIQKLNLRLIFDNVQEQRNQEQQIDLLNLPKDDVDDTEGDQSDYNANITEAQRSAQQPSSASPAAVAEPLIKSAISEKIASTAGNSEADKSDGLGVDEDDASVAFTNAQGTTLGENNIGRPSQLHLRHFSSDLTAVTENASTDEPGNNSPSIINNHNTSFSNHEDQATNTRVQL